jgi:hypothetical protein
MSDTEGKVEIDLSQDTQAPADAIKVHEEEPKIEVVDETKPVEAKDDGIEKTLKKLNKKLEKEKKARSEAENMARLAQEQAAAAAMEVNDSQLHLVTGAIESLKRDQEILKVALKESMASGDYDKSAELQFNLSENLKKLTDLEYGLKEMKANPPKPVMPVPQSHDAVVEGIINRLTPKSAKWLKDNREHIKSDKELRIMRRAHEDAVDRDIPVESKEYFKFVEKRMGIRKKEKSESNPEGNIDAMSDASKGQKRQSSPPAAPVTNVTSSQNYRNGTATLTNAEVEAARISGVSLQEYYRNKMREQNRLN